jgi:RNA polymerase sigma-70 factor (ECF subfamily)
MPTTAIANVCKTEGARVIAGLIRRFGDFSLAEDALQDAFEKALSVWAVDGIPDRPAAWLTTVAQRRALDVLRRRKIEPIAMEEPPDISAPQADEEQRHPADITGVEDDRLRLLFTCCHPALAPRVQAALALRTLCGLSTREIARAFLESEPTTAQRLVRAKRKILEAKIPYEVPSREALPARLDTVLGVVYLVFNEGYAATDSPSLVRLDTCLEAMRLGRLIVELMPEEAEARGLLALMLLHDARREARLDAAGAIVPLEEQDRSRWNRPAIDEGVAMLDSAVARHASGPYQIQAAIAALHAGAKRAEDTDWIQIAALYGGLLRWTPTPVVELNAAVALAMAEGIERGLTWIDRLAGREELADYYLLPAARADLLRRSGRLLEARDAYVAALSLVRHAAERAYLERRLKEVSEPNPVGGR